MGKPLLSVIIVSWNVSRLLQRCLQTVQLAVKDISSEILVIDNASRDGTLEMLTQDFPDIHVLAQKENLGFGRANNLGVEHSKGDFLLLLNPDTEVNEDAIVVLLAAMKADPQMGFAGPQILNADGSFQEACRRMIPTPQCAFYKMIGLSKLFPNHARFSTYNYGKLSVETVSKVEAISGSCMCIRREAWGFGFDERYFMYAEDLDLCWDIRKKGYYGQYVPDAVITHLYRGSSSKRCFRSLYHFYLAAFLFFHKHYFGKMNMFLFVLLTIGLCVKFVLAYICTMMRCFLTFFKERRARGFE
jgi:GT2 family glycosyltransferase